MTRHSKALPSGWQKVRFGDVVRLSSDRCINPAAANVERYVGLEHLTPGDLRIRSWGLVSDGVTFTNCFKPGQVLFGKRRAYQRKVAIADFEGVCSGDIYVFDVADSRLLPDLLPFICQTEGFFQHALRTSAGSLSPRTNWTSLADYEFDLPPHPVQLRVAKLLAARESLVASYQSQAQAAECLERSFLVHQVSSLLDEPSVSRVTIGESGEVIMGRQRSPSYTTGRCSHKYLRVANVFDDCIDTSDVLEMDFDTADRERYRLRNGDLLLNEGQSLELLGRCAMYRGELDGAACFQNTLIRYRPVATSADFALTWMRHLYYKGTFAQLGSKTTSIAHLGLRRFIELPFAVPDRKREAEIVSQSELLRKARRDAAHRYAQAISSLATAVSLESLLSEVPA